MAELTQEQIDALVAEKVAEAKRGLFDESELNKRVVSEVDRRVETGIQKGLETQKKKWEQEFAEKAKLSAEELAKKELDEKFNEISTKEKEIKKKSNLIEAKDMFSNASVPKSKYEKVLSLLVSEDEETTKINVQHFIEVFNSTKSELETQIRSEYTKIPQPNQGDGDKPTTKEEFNKMSYGDKMKFKTDFPELFKEFTK